MTHRDPYTLTKAELDERIQQMLGTWPRNLNDALDNDPRCDCDPDCPYNDPIELDRAWEIAC